MAKIEDSGELVLPDKGRPPRIPPPRASKPPRGFPFRLLLWALLMTAGAGAAGYFAWQYREQAIERRGGLATCTTDLEKIRGEHGAASGQLQTCTGELATVTEREKALAANLGSTTEELTALRDQRKETDARLASFAEITQKFAKMIDTGQLAVKARRGNLVVELPAEVLFASGVSELSEKGKLAVLEVGFILKQDPDRRFLVVGHTDSVPLKNSKYLDNLELSTARALTVTRVLVQAGMKPENLLPAGAGEHDPTSDNASSKDRQANRRIEIALLPALSEMPPLPSSIEAGKAAATPPAKPATPP
jgi:chemotaxis protein MotB